MGLYGMTWSCPANDLSAAVVAVDVILKFPETKVSNIRKIRSLPYVNEVEYFFGLQDILLWV